MRGFRQEGVDQGSKGHELPGVGQNLFYHLSAQVALKVKDVMTLAADADAVHFGLHYTSQ